MTFLVNTRKMDECRNGCCFKVQVDRFIEKPMTKKTPAALMGRPPKPANEKYKTTARQIGRISEREWEELQSAAKREGKTFTAWAKDILLIAARIPHKKGS